MNYLKTCLFLMLQLCITSIHAHAFIEEAQPKAGEELDVSPKVIELTYDREIEPALSRIEISSMTSDVPIKTGKVQNAEGAPNKLVLPVFQLERGRYHVNWVALSNDGHQTVGDYSFTIK